MSAQVNEGIRYEPEERCSPWLAAVVGIQGVMTVLAIIVLITATSVLATGQSRDTLEWSVFAALIVCGMVCGLQATRWGRLGGGHILITGVTPNYIAVSALALEAGGPAVLAGLVVLSGLFYVIIARWLPLLRKVITPVVSGTVLMLIATMILPFSVDRLAEAPENANRAGGLAAAAVTVGVITVLFLRARGTWRLWSLLFGIAAGCAVAVPLGLYEHERVLAAPWFGIPDGGLPGVDLALSPGAWALLPMFLIVTLVQAIKSIGDNMAAQQVSYRRRRTIDFRSIQGAIYANGLGILLSGVAGTPPTAAYSSSTVSLVHITGVAARRVGYAMGTILVALALLPKATAVLVAIPSPVMGAVVLFVTGTLFMEGLRTVAQSGLNPQNIVMVGLAYAVGVGMMQRNVLEGVLEEPWDLLLGDGLTLGAVTAVGLSLFLRLSRARPKRLRIALDNSSFPRIDGFLRDLAREEGWDDPSTQRLRSAGEETLSSLLAPTNRYPDDETVRLILLAYPAADVIEMEFLTVVEEESLQDRLAYLDDELQTWDEREISFRLLRHYASDVRHQKYHGMDIITVRVESS
ncbi:MAG: purine/pyrimidine permease [bacterium]|nr:purine/pyrimidine permease [bacterium]